MSLIAIDLGTSFIKGAVLEVDTFQINHIQRMPCPSPLPNLPGLLHETNPTAMVDATQALLTKLLPLAPDCQGIVLCSQMHGLVLTDAVGTPHSNFISWQDQRILMPHPSGKGSYFDQLLAKLTPLELQQLGSELHPSRPLCFLYWLAQEGALPTGLIPASLPSFIIANLCRTTPQVEATDAAAYSALNLETLDWHHDIIGRLGLAHLQWPTVVPFGTATGLFESDSRQLPIYAPIGDHQCALLGAFLQPQELSFNIATGSQASFLSTDLQYGDYQLRPFFDGHFLKTITSIPAGRALNHLVNLLCEMANRQQVELRDPWQTIAETLSEIEKTDLHINLSFFDSMGGDSGGITNIREDNLSIGHLFRAAFADMAENYHTCAVRLSPEHSWKRLVFSGGVAQKSDHLRQMIVRRFQVESRLCHSTEDSLMGLLVVALVVSGQVSAMGQAVQVLTTHLDKEIRIP